MNGSTPKARARNLNKELRRLYDPYGGVTNVIDILTDLRHLCDAQGWNFAEADRIAYGHYIPELQERKI